MLFEFESERKVLAAFSSLENLKRDPALLAMLPESVAAAIAVNLQVDMWSASLVGSLIAIPVRPLPEDPVAALIALATLPLVGARVLSESAPRVVQLCIERWPRSCDVFNSEVELVFRNGRLVSVPLPARPETLVYVSVLEPERYFRPVLEPQGKGVGAIVPMAVLPAQRGDVLNECSVAVSVVTQKLKPVAQFQFMDDDGVCHIISSNAEAACRYDKVRGFLRVWTSTLAYKFIRDLEIDFKAVCTEIGFAGLPSFSGMDGTLFPLVRRVHQSPCLSSAAQIEKVLCAQWSLTDPTRLRLADLAAEAIVWPAHTSPGLQFAGRETLRSALFNIGRVFAAIWDNAFLGAFQPFLDILDATPNIPDRYSVIYLVARIEIALSCFAAAVFRSPASPPVVGTRRERRSPADWASVLSAAISQAADTSRWELPPTREFFQPGGEFESLFATTPVATKRPRGGKTRGKVDDEPSAAASTSKRQKQPNDDPSSSVRPCYAMMASWLKAKNDDGDVFSACERNGCRYSHDVKFFHKLSVSQLEAFARRTPRPFRDAMLAAIKVRAPVPK